MLEILKKIKAWWYFLMVIFFLSISTPVFAESYFSNFDDNTTGSLLVYWGNTTATTTHYFTPFYSYTMGELYHWLSASSTYVIIQGRFYIEEGKAGDGYFAISNWSTLQGLLYWNKDSVRCYSNSVEKYNFQAPTTNSWHTVKLVYTSNGDLGCYFDNYVSSTTAPIITSWVAQTEPTASFVDDILISSDYGESTTPPVDAIDLINPEDASIQNKNIFYWAYNFTISSTSYAAYDSFDTQIEYIPPIAGATSTFIESNWYKPAVQPETAYIIIYDKAYNIPLYLGNYTAGAYLIGLKNNSFDILASDFVNFTMSEGTTTAQTAWCSGLCNDLATTTSSWWPPLVCAGRYVICYAMYPHDLTKQMFWQAYNDFKLVFPFNIFFEITSTIDNVFASTTMASTTGSFGLPMIRKVGTTSQYYILPLLTSTTTANFLGNSNANLLRFSLSSIIYAFYTVGIILILW